MKIAFNPNSERLALMYQNPKPDVLNCENSAISIFHNLLLHQFIGILI